MLPMIRLNYIFCWSRLIQIKVGLFGNLMCQSNHKFVSYKYGYMEIWIYGWSVELYIDHVKTTRLIFNVFVQIRQFFFVHQNVYYPIEDPAHHKSCFIFQLGHFVTITNCNPSLTDILSCLLGITSIGLDVLGFRWIFFSDKYFFHHYPASTKLCL